MTHCTDIDAMLQDLFEDNEGEIQQVPPSIPGLTYIPGCLGQQQQDTLLQQVDAAGWFQGGNSSKPSGCSNQAMVFGLNNMPQWLQQLGQQLPLQGSWPKGLAERHPRFDTAIINLYLPGDGITPHVDLLRFSDGIAIISLGDAAIMNLTPECGCEGQQQLQHHHHHHLQQHTVHQHVHPAEQLAPGEEQQHQSSTQLQDLQELCQPVQQQHPSLPPEQHQSQQQCHQQLLLRGGDLLLLHGEARYHWRHGIAPVKQETLLCSGCRQASQRIAAVAAGGHNTNDLGVVQTVTEQVGDDTGCQLCVYVVRGKRVSITLRRLDSSQTVLDTQ